MLTLVPQNVYFCLEELVTLLTTDSQLLSEEQ